MFGYEDDVRYKIDITERADAIMFQICAGDVNSMHAISKLIKDELEDRIYFELLDDMNIRGAQIFAAFLYCGRDAEAFRSAVQWRDPDMVEAVNAFSQEQGIPHKAVTSGARQNRETF